MLVLFSFEMLREINSEQQKRVLGGNGAIIWRYKSTGGVFLAPFSSRGKYWDEQESLPDKHIAKRLVPSMEFCIVHFCFVFFLSQDSLYGSGHVGNR